jgi:hypothetical protein
LAVARAMPDVPPVMTATLSFNFSIVSILFFEQSF